MGSFVEHPQYAKYETLLYGLFLKKGVGRISAARQGGSTCVAVLKPTKSIQRNRIEKQNIERGKTHQNTQTTMESFST